VFPLLLILHSYLIELANAIGRNLEMPWHLFRDNLIKIKTLKKQSKNKESAHENYCGQKKTWWIIANLANFQ
jgi:hypothetical protein